MTNQRTHGEPTDHPLAGVLVLDLDQAHFMGLALEQAEGAYRSEEVPVGAVLIAGDGMLLGAAHNRPITARDPTAHAEIGAIREACIRCGNYRLAGTILYVTLEPCAMCLGALLQARVRRLVFGARDPKAGAAGSVVDLTNVAVFNHHLEVVSGVRAAECAALLQRFFAARR